MTYTNYCTTTMWHISS